MPPTPTPPRRRRWFRILAGLVLAIVLAGLAAVPSLIGTGMVRGRILEAINARLAPGRLSVQQFAVSWTGPTRLVGFRLLAPDGACVVEAPVAELNRSLGGLLLGSNTGTVLLLDHAALAVRRSVDGHLDLAEALQTVVNHPDPTRDLTVRVTQGSLILRADQLADPMIAQTTDLDLQIPPSPRAMTWNLRLSHADGGRIEAKGAFNRWAARDQDPSQGNLQLDFESASWPVRLRTGGWDAAGALDGSVELSRQSARWRSVGDLRWRDGSLTGRVLAGDSLRPGLITAIWDGIQRDDHWSIRRLTLDSALGSFRAEGDLDLRTGIVAVDPGAARIDGRVDLAAVAGQLPHTLRLRPGLTVNAGTARFLIERRAADPSLIRAEATVADLAARDGDRQWTLRDPATLTAEVVRVGDAITVRQLTARTTFGHAAARGRLDDLTLTGSADLGALRRQLGEWFDLGRLDGSGRAEMSGSYRNIDQQFVARLAVQGHDIHLDGLTVGPVDRPDATLDLTMTGRPAATGWPSSWDMVLLSVASGPAAGRLELRPAGGSVRVQARVTGMIPGLDEEKPIEATLDGSWAAERRLLTCDRFCTRVISRPGQDDMDDLALVASGEIDARAGSVRFDPIDDAGSSSRSLRLAPGGIRIVGLGDDLGALRIDVGLEGDLRTPANRAEPGVRWAAALAAHGDPQGVQVSAQGEIGSAQAAGAGSVRLAGRYDLTSDRFDLSELQARSAFGVLSGVGRVDDITRTRRFDFHGELKPDFAAITAQLARSIEPGAKIDGQSRPFRLAGMLSGADALGTVEGEVGVDLLMADIYGMKLGPTPVVLRARDGRLQVDPISTTLNEGHLRLEPEIALEPGTGAAILKLGKNSAIRDALINDEVSRRVLAFVAPVLEGATRASGRVSVDLDRAEFPLAAGRSKAVQVDGQVVFGDVAFAPGALANDLLGAIGRRDAVLRLDRPITLTIADGRVNQSGLALPIGSLTRIEVAGWVDFDRKLALIATLPVTPAMLGDNPLLTDLAAGTMVRLPIGGTLDQPAIDQEAFAAGLKDMGKSLLTRGATRGALELLMRLGRPAARNDDDPARTAPLSPAERKALRLERKADRKANRGLDAEATPNP